MYLIPATMSNRDQTGTWLVRNFCNIINDLTNDTPLETILTILQNKIHNDTVNEGSGQTIEVKYFPHRKITLFKYSYLKKVFNY